MELLRGFIKAKDIKIKNKTSKANVFQPLKFGLISCLCFVFFFLTDPLSKHLGQRLYVISDSLLNKRILILNNDEMGWLIWNKMMQKLLGTI